MIEKIAYAIIYTDQEFYRSVYFVFHEKASTVYNKGAYIEDGNIYELSLEEQYTFTDLHVRHRNDINYHKYGPHLKQKVSLYQLMNNWYMYLNKCEGFMKSILNEYIEYVLNNPQDLVSNDASKRAIAELHTSLALKIDETLNGIKKEANV
jgi:hypothetical protein